MSNSDTTIGERLRALRQKRGMSQVLLADLSGVSHTSIHLWETGKKHPATKTLRPVAELLGVTVEYLINGNEADVL